MLSFRTLASYFAAMLLSSLLSVGAYRAFLPQATHASAAPAEALRARDFQLVNSKGAVIAHLRSGANDEPELSLYDQKHIRRASLFLESNGTPDLYLWNQAGRAQLSLDLYDSGYGNLFFADASGRHAISIEQTKTSGLAIRSLDIRPDGSGVSPNQTFLLFNSPGQGLAIQDPKGQTVWKSDTEPSGR